MLVHRALSFPISAYSGLSPLHPSPLPSAKAVELASLIGPGDGPYAQALKATAERRYDDATSFFTQAETTSTDRRKLYVARADMEGYAGRYAQQIDWLQKALSLSPDDTDLLIKLGNARIAAGSFKEAELPSQQAASILESGRDQSAGAIARANLVCAYLQEGNTEKAKAANDTVLEMSERKWGPDDPRTAIAIVNAAGIEAAQGHENSAEDLLQRALSSQDGSCPHGADRAFTLHFLGELYRQRGNYGGFRKGVE